MKLRRRTYLFPSGFRRQYPMARGFLARQRDRRPKQAIPKRKGTA